MVENFPDYKLLPLVVKRSIIFTSKPLPPKIFSLIKYNKEILEAASMDKAWARPWVKACAKYIETLKIDPEQPLSTAISVLINAMHIRIENGIRESGEAPSQALVELVNYSKDYIETKSEEAPSHALVELINYLKDYIETEIEPGEKRSKYNINQPINTSITTKRLVLNVNATNIFTIEKVLKNLHDRPGFLSKIEYFSIVAEPSFNKSIDISLLQSVLHMSPNLRALRLYNTNLEVASLHMLVNSLMPLSSLQVLDLEEPPENIEKVGYDFLNLLEDFLQKRPNSQKVYVNNVSIHSKKDRCILS